MLFVALTRSSIPQLPASGSPRQFPFAPGWLLTCATDDFLSRLSMSKDEIAVWESLLGGHVDSNHDVSLVTACFLPALQTLQVSKSSVSGRPVYYCTNSRGEFFASSISPGCGGRAFPSKKTKIFCPNSWSTGLSLRREPFSVAFGSCASREAWSST
jgi:hypothetical protein